jgi:hypothetical protein
VSLFSDLRRNFGDTDHNFVRFDTQDSAVRNATDVNVFSYPLVVYKEDISSVNTFILSNKDAYYADFRSRLNGTQDLADKSSANSFGGMGVLSVHQVKNPTGIFREFLVGDDWIDASASTSYSGVTSSRVLELSSTTGEVVWKCLEYHPSLTIRRAWFSHSRFEVPSGVEFYIGSADNPNGTSVSWSKVNSYFEPVTVDDKAAYLKAVFSGVDELDFRSFGRNGSLVISFEYEETKDL